MRRGAVMQKDRSVVARVATKPSRNPNRDPTRSQKRAPTRTRPYPGSGCERGVGGVIQRHPPVDRKIEEALEAQEVVELFADYLCALAEDVGVTKEPNGFVQELAVRSSQARQ